jgi:tRNA (guanine37-N1)-methyltransferase
MKVINIRDATTDKHKTVDDTPSGGGVGMLLKADVLANSLDQNKIDGEKNNIELHPYFENFNGKVIKDYGKQKKYLIKGKYKVISADTIQVTELPILRNG